ncbi:MAG: adventurous gliding motility protein GltC [Deltaproteobacteria bacterium]|nr:adventurous gliding motility protein GltC [Deltaproteobacteria bacterium]
MRLLRVGTALVFGLSLLGVTAPGAAAAQMSFDGFDLSEGGESKPEPKKKKKGKKKKKKKAEPEESGGGFDLSGDSGDTGGGFDLTGESGASGSDFGIDLTGDSGESGDTGSSSAGGDGFSIDIGVGDAEVKSDEGSGLAFDELVLEETPESRRAMDAAMRLAEKENHDAAAVAFYNMLQDPKMAAFHQQAEYLLAKSLYKKELYHSSLARFSRILAAGEGHKYFQVGLEWLFFISRKTVNESVVLEQIAAYADQEFPEKYKDEFLYLLAKYYFARARALQEAGQEGEASASFDEVNTFLSQISQNTKFYPKARFLTGLAKYQAGDPQASVEEFKEVVRMTNPRKGKYSNDDLRDLAFMQLARLHYEHKQNRYAAFYFGKIRRDSDQWLESLFESSWGYFRLGDYEKALGNMVTLHSPFFEEEYFPESLILKAVIYYENCRYPEAKAIVDEFERVYGPVQAELQKLTTSNRTPEQYYDLLADTQKGIEAGKETDEVMARILKAALTDKEFEAMNDSIREVEREIERIETGKDVFKFSAISKELLISLKEERYDLIQKAGMMAGAKLYAEGEALRGLIGQGLRIRFETTTKEKEYLEAQLAAGGKLDVVKDYGYSVAVSDETLYWPYEGEYWRDELGTFEYTLTKGCKDRLAVTAAGD